MSQQLPRLALETSRHAAVLRRVLEHHASPDAVVLLDGAAHAGAEALRRLAVEWCTNRQIRATHEFLLRKSGLELFGFHDGPEELWAAPSELAFVESLAAQKLLRYRALQEAPSLGQRLRLLLRRLVSGARRDGLS